MSRKLRTAVFALSAVAGAALFVTLSGHGDEVRRHVAGGEHAFFPGLDAVLVRAGFGLDQVAVGGHRFTPDGDILDAVAMPGARTWRTFDARAARQRIEKLPWIATAELTRVYPGRLDVRVSERKAFAVWQHGQRETLIDATGRQLSDIRSGGSGDAFSELPRFEGEGASTEAAAMFALVARHPEISRRTRLFERVSGRRWTLHLDNGSALVLPPDREALVLDGLMSSARLKRLALESGRIVDLRAPGRVAVRAAGGDREHRRRIAEGGP